MTKYRLIFMDGSTEVVDVSTLFIAWLAGKVKARAKKTYLLNIEEIRGSPVETKGSLTPQLLILEKVSVPGPEVRRARV
jgi:hypothetical protein